MKKVLFDVLCGDVTLYDVKKISGHTLTGNEICHIRDIVDVDAMNTYKETRMAFILENDNNCFATTIIIEKEDIIEFNNNIDIRITGEELYDFVEDRKCILENTSFDIQDLYEILVEWQGEDDSEWMKDILGQ